MANQEAAGPNHAARAQPQPARTRAGSRAAPRRLPSRYKMRILNEYEALDRRGKTTLLRREGLRASQLSRWRSQARAAAGRALGAEPGSQPARPVHVSDDLWALFTETAARHDPPVRPERLIRAFIRYHVGLTDHLPPRPAPAGSPPPAVASGADDGPS